jgi:WD40 repeat protein
MGARHGVIALIMIALLLVAGCGQTEPTADATPVPSTASLLPPVATATPIPTEPAISPTATPVPPTATRVPPTPLLASATPLPPSATPLPPSATPTAAPPTETPTREATPTTMPAALVKSEQGLGDWRSFDVALGDLDGDGDLDAFVASDDGDGKGSVVWLNDGAGTFSLDEQDLGYGTAVKLGDLDADGDLDALVIDFLEAVKVLMNQGGAQGGTPGVLVDSGQRLGGRRCWETELGDLDGDGDLDAFFANEEANKVWLNDGQGQFTDSGQELGEARTCTVELGDLDGDGDLDALTAGWGERVMVWFNGAGAQGGEAGTFEGSRQRVNGAGHPIHSLALGDLDGDGDLDAVVGFASQESANEVWLNEEGAFEHGGQVLQASLTHDIALGDLNGDGALDAFMVTASMGPTRNKVWLNQGNGRLFHSRLYLGNPSSHGVELGDLDGDGDLDAFVANGELWRDSGGGLPDEVWLNELAVSAPTATPAPVALSPETAEGIELLRTLEGHDGRIYALDFSSDGSLLASASHDGTIRLWDVETWQAAGAFEHSGDWAVYVAPDDAHVASENGTIWEIATGEQVRTLEGQNPHVAFSPDGVWMASAGLNAAIELWDVESWQLVRTLEGHTDRVFGMDFTPDGSLLASGSGLGPNDVSDFTVRVWDVMLGQEIHTLQAHRGDVHAVAFAPDGALLASASTDGTVKVWDVQSGQLVHTLRQGDGLYDVAFSPDGTLLASAGVDRTVKLWDVASGRALRTLRHGDEVMAVAFAPDGSLLASGGYDNVLYLWGIPR